jgi:type VII secretion protein EssB
MRKKSLETSNIKQPKIETEKNIEFLKEEIKKSAIHAKDSYDYQKLCVKRNGLLSCHYEEDREDLYFYYTVKGMNPFIQVKSESREKKYQILINFSKLKELQADFLLKLTEENLYYDENGLLYLKDRDIYGRGEKPDDTYFLNAYKSFVAGVLGSKYSVKQIQESGIEICKEEKWFEPIYNCQTVEEIADVLRNVKKDYVTEQSQQMQKVKKSTYSLWRIVAIITLIGTLIGGGYAAYLSLKTVPEQRQLLAANEAFIQKDYRTCIDSLREVEPADMEKGTLYILAYSYANMESFRQDEMRNIIDNFSTSSNPKILEYWIRIGRLETKKAEEIALSLSDDKLLIYAYMKEADDLENNTKIDGSKKKQRLDELESQIEKLGDKYEPKEEETVEKIDGAVQEDTSTQEPQTDRYCTVEMINFAGGKSMGDFWDDIKKKNEERRIAGIKSDIRVLEEQIKEYEDAKKKVESAKKKCNSECEEWKEKLGELKGKEIKQTGIFEGEMANALENYINDAKEENDTAIQRTGDLVSSLGTQIEKIDDKISQLESRIKYKRSLI